MPNFNVVRDGSEYTITVDAVGNISNITVSKLVVTDGVASFELVETISPVVGGGIPEYTTVITLEPDNVYQFESTSDPVDVEDGVINIIDDTSFVESMLFAIEEIVCGCDCDEWNKGAKSMAVYYFNRLTLSQFTYLSIVNEYNAEEYIYDVLNEDQLVELVKLVELTEKIKTAKTCIENLDKCKCR